MKTALARALASIRGSLSLILIALNTVAHSIPIYLLAIPKLLPIGAGNKRRVRRWLAALAESWIARNSQIIARYPDMRWQVNLPPDLRADHNYFVNCNHQSWVDIVVLQHVLNRRIPFLRFFLKRQLIWVPFLGIAWWALDFPFMGRYSKSQIASNPTLRDRDRRATQQMCDRLADVPISIMNFLEGTRRTTGKQAAQRSPFAHLLKPKAGGLAFTMTTLRERIDHMLDVSIAYPAGVPSLWEMMCGRLDQIVVDVREVAIPDWMPKGNYQADVAYRKQLHGWLNELWLDKDALLGQLLNSKPRSPRGEPQTPVGKPRPGE